MADDLVSLIESDTVVKVSSTLDKSVGKKNLTDGNVESCWTSQQGLPQWIQLQFSHPVIPRRLSLVFQGGFVGTQCSIQVPTFKESLKEWKTWTRIYPEDVNRPQTFDLSPLEAEPSSEGVQSIKLIFEESSDFFGRITVYDLVLEGLGKTSMGVDSKAND